MKSPTNVIDAILSSLIRACQHTRTHTHTYTSARAHIHADELLFSPNAIRKKNFFVEFSLHSSIEWPHQHHFLIRNLSIFELTYMQNGNEKKCWRNFFFLHFFGLTANERHTVGKKIHFTVCSRLASQQKTNSQLNIDIVGALVSLCGPWVRAHHSNSFPLTTCRLIHVVYQHIDTHSLACRYMSHSAARVVQSGRWIHVCYFTLQKNGLRCVNVYWHRSYSRVDGIACVRKREGEYVRMLELCWHLAAYIDSDPSADTKHHFRFL